MPQCAVPARPIPPARRGRRHPDLLAKLTAQAVDLTLARREIDRLRPIAARVQALTAELRLSDRVGWGATPRPDLAGYGARGLVYAGPGASRTQIRGLQAAAAAYAEAAWANRPAHQTWPPVYNHARGEWIRPWPWIDGTYGSGDWYWGRGDGIPPEW